MALSVAGGGGTTICKSVGGNSTLYTVPAGKTFEGYIWNTSSNGPGYINGTRLYWPYSNSYFVHERMYVQLNSGDEVLGDTSGTTMILGVEK